MSIILRPSVIRQLAQPMCPRRYSGPTRPFTTGPLAVAGMLMSLLGGCAPDDELPLPPVVWEGESVRVRMDDPEIEV